jgi:hypothetical protein
MAVKRLYRIQEPPASIDIYSEVIKLGNVVPVYSDGLAILRQ